MASILITGSNRGIGLELVRQLSEQPPSKVSKIFAVTRRPDGPNGQLHQLTRSSQGRVEEIVIEDITDETSARKGAEKVSSALPPGKGLDVLVNNAGVAPANPEGIESMSGKELLEVLNVNAVSVHVLTAAFLPLLRKGEGRKVLNISTPLGSFARVESYSWAKTYAYKISKAAMNMLTVQWAMDLKGEGFTVFAMSPGWLKTDLGSQGADLEVSVGVASVREKLFAADKADNGKFWNIRVAGWEKAGGPNQYEGGEIEW